MTSSQHLARKADISEVYSPQKGEVGNLAVSKMEKPLMKEEPQKRGAVSFVMCGGSNDGSFLIFSHLRSFSISLWKKKLQSMGIKAERFKRVELKSLHTGSARILILVATILWRLCV